MFIILIVITLIMYKGCNYCSDFFNAFDGSVEENCLHIPAFLMPHVIIIMIFTEMPSAPCIASRARLSSQLYFSGVERIYCSVCPRLRHSMLVRNSNTTLSLTSLSPLWTHPPHLALTHSPSHSTVRTHPPHLALTHSPSHTSLKTHPHLITGLTSPLLLVPLFHPHQYSCYPLYSLSSKI